jgi:hypothetical protein
MKYESNPSLHDAVMQQSHAVREHLQQNEHPAKHDLQHVVDILEDLPQDRRAVLKPTLP